MSRIASVAFGLRRMSRFPAADGGGGSSSSRMSQAPTQMIRLENTYRTEPEPEDKFNSEKASRIIKTVLTRFLKGEKYNPKNCSEKTQRLSEVIRREMKDLGYNRYKLVVHSFIGEPKHQGFQLASRCLWLSDYDTTAEASYKDENIFGVVIVFAVYFE